MCVEKSPIESEAACWRWMDAVWRKPSESFHLPSDCAHIWRCQLNVADSVLNDYTAALTQEERCHTEHIRCEKRRREYIVGRVVARRTLAGYHGVTEKEVDMGHDSRGKPEIISPRSELPLFVSMSHCDNTLLLAVARQAIGVDVERMRDAKRYPRVVRHIFPPAWAQTLERAANSPEEQSLLFTRYWTACESLHKLVGDGILRSARRLLETKTGFWGCHFEVGERYMAAATTARPCLVSWYATQSSPLTV